MLTYTKYRNIKCLYSNKKTLVLNNAFIYAHKDLSCFCVPLKTINDIIFIGFYYWVELINHLFFPPASQIKKTIADNLSTGSPFKKTKAGDGFELEHFI